MENGSGNAAERFNHRGNNNYKIILKQSVNTPKTSHTLRVSGDAMENKYRNSPEFFGLQRQERKVVGGMGLADSYQRAAGLY